MKNLTVVDHPLLKRDLTILRRRETPYGVFRKTLSDAAAILAYEAMRTLDLRLLQIETPLETTTGYEIADEVFVVPILRAGLGMVDGFVMHFIGAILAVSTIWDLGDVALSLVTIPNVLSLLLLSGLLKKITDSYFQRQPWLENYEVHKRLKEEKRRGKI